LRGLLLGGRKGKGERKGKGKPQGKGRRGEEREGRGKGRWMGSIRKRAGR